MIEFIMDNWVAILAVFSTVGTVYQYFDKKKWERRWKEFEVYHKLI